MEYDMEDFFKDCVRLYAELTDTDPSTYPKSGAPFGPELTTLEDGQGGPRGEVVPPAEEALAECLRLNAQVGPPDREITAGGPPLDDHDAPDPRPPAPSGLLQPIAAKVLMKILYGARMARYDLLNAVCKLAACVTKWTEQQDIDLFRLICYIQSTLHYRLVSWVGDDISEVWIRQYADADLASDIRTHRSTSANSQKIYGPYTRAYQSCNSRRQTATSHSTLEAEIVSADEALRRELLPALPLWRKLLDREPRAEFMEDNQAVVKVCKAGGSQKLMHLPRTHRIDASAVAEQFSRGTVDLVYTPTQDQAADIGTKRFDQPASWVKVLYLTQIVAPSFWTSDSYKDYLDSQFEGEQGLPVQPGGILKPKLGPNSPLKKPGAKIPGKTAKKKPKRQNKGKPPPDAPPRLLTKQQARTTDAAPAPMGLCAKHTKHTELPDSLSVDGCANDVIPTVTLALPAVLSAVQEAQRDDPNRVRELTRVRDCPGGHDNNTELGAVAQSKEPDNQENNRQAERENAKSGREAVLAVPERAGHGQSGGMRDAMQTHPEDYSYSTANSQSGG